MLMTDEERRNDDSRRGFREEFGRRVCGWTLAVLERVGAKMPCDTGIYNVAIRERFSGPFGAEVEIEFDAGLRLDPDGGFDDHPLGRVTKGVCFLEDVGRLAVVADEIAADVFKRRFDAMRELGLIPKDVLEAMAEFEAADAAGGA